ncbi:MAG: hypothetical protein Q9180_000178 [Flavoplaca navasiana]
MANGDMDIDMDIDLGPIDIPEASDISPIVALVQKLTCVQNLPAPATSTPSPDRSAEQLGSNVVTHKVHIQGVDNLTTDDVKIFVAEHCSDEVPCRFEWVDDSSVNVVYGTPAAALRALESFTLLFNGQEPASSIPNLQLRSAKSLSSRPEARLQVRTAVSTDVKRPRAHEASRFYMMNPEFDPRATRTRRRNPTEGNGDHQRRRYGDGERRRRRLQDRESGLKPSIYDDDRVVVRSKEDVSRRSSFSMNSSGSNQAADRLDRRVRSRHAHSGDYYRPGEISEPSVHRNRSASPDKHHDDDADGTIVGRRLRQRTPPPANRNKELFPAKCPTIASSKDLFPNKSIAAELKRELFPTKTANSHHRRTGAFDAADETADLFAVGMAISNRGDKKSAGDVGFGRLRSSDPVPQYEARNGMEDSGITIRGASHGQESGVSIRGAAGGTLLEADQELFSRKMGNVGKELFAEKLQGRGLRRKKAEDMFY